MNTEFSYLYRDASNYKKGHAVIFEGVLTEEQKEEIRDQLDAGEYFIPGDVGLPELQKEMISYPSGDDHIWHEFQEMEETTESATETRTVQQFYDHFMQLNGQWNEMGAIHRLDV